MRCAFIYRLIIWRKKVDLNFFILKQRTIQSIQGGDMDKEYWTERLIVPLYEEGHLQTLWNAKLMKNHREGWRLKNGSWSPYFFNMRQAGDSPGTFHGICSALDHLAEEANINLAVGVEMAGIPLVGGMQTANFERNFTTKRYNYRIGYTRPLPIKPRTPIEAINILAWIDKGKLGNQKKISEVINEITVAETWLSNFRPRPSKEIARIKKVIDILNAIHLNSDQDYGQKEFLEARLNEGDRVGIIDDMSTDLGSKVIARMIVLWQAEKRGIKIDCNRILYLLNRNKENKQKGLGFANETDSRLYPDVLKVDYVIELDDSLRFLKKFMRDEEYELIVAYQKRPEQFQDEGTIKEALALAASY
jgi:orotate phosphoribosyltransferase